MATKYWTNRFEKLKIDEMNRVDTTISDLEDVYAYSLQRLQVDIDHWYHRYASDNNLALSDARKQLDARELKDFKLTLKQYEKLAQQKDLSKEHIKMLQNASIRVRLDRAQQLYIQVLQHTALLANNEQEILTKALSDAYESSAYKIAYETQLMTSKYKDVPLLNKTAVEQAIYKPWTNDGKEFSSRIWDNRQNLVDTLQSEITRSLIIGEGSGKLADRIAKRYNVSFNNARRLAETETAHVQELASKEQYENNGIEQYEILATLDNRTSSTCRHLDGKIVDMKDYKAGVTAPPFHCYCRTTTIPYIKGITDSKEDTRAYRDEYGKTAYTDETLSYDEWYNKYVKGENNNSDNKKFADFNSALQSVYNQALEYGHKTGNEGLFWINKDGSEAFKSLTGTSNQVVFTPELMDFLNHANDGTLQCVHNHPGSSSFSPQDLNVMCKYSSIDTMYVIAHDGTEYTCSVNGGIRGEWTDIFNSYEDYRVELHNKYMEMYNNGATQQETWKEHSNEIIEKIAEKYKWKYTRKLPK